MLKRLLVPLDGSSLAEQAIGRAAAIARATGADVDLVRVHQPDAYDGYGDVPVDDQAWNEGHRYLEGIASDLELGASINVTHAMLIGPPEEMIRRRTADTQADLIVMTSHGRTGFNRAWFGSVADGLVRRSEVPVLILRPIAGESRHGSPNPLFDHVLVPLDGSTTAAEILPVVSALARYGGARVTLLGVIQPMPLPAYNPAASLIPYSILIQDDAAIAQLAESAKKELTAHATRLASEGVGSVAAEVVVAGSVARAIIEFARAHDVDLVAIATHGRGASRLFVGSVADKVLRASGLPVLLQRCAPTTEPADSVRATAPDSALAWEAPA